MPKNLKASERYKVIDRCLKSRAGMTAEEIRQRCCFELGYDDDGIKIRTIQKDLKEDFTQVYENAKIIKVKKNRSIYYRYEDPSFSITPEKLTKTDMECLTQVMKMLKCFNGIALQGISNELQKLIDTKDMDEGSKSVVSFEQNPLFDYMKNIPELFDAIINKTVIEIDYKPFEEEECKRIIHPYYIKQYNKRWYLLGYEKCDDNRDLSTLALDSRILSIDLCPNIKFKDCEIDFDEYFEDIIGVTKFKEKSVSTILLAINKTRSKLLDTNPLHGSHTYIRNIPEEYSYLSDKFDFYRYEVIENNELINSLLQFGKDVIVLKPESLKEKMASIFEEGLKNYCKFDI